MLDGLTLLEASCRVVKEVFRTKENGEQGQTAYAIIGTRHYTAGQRASATTEDIHTPFWACCQ
jgi:hypothetical protein